MNSKSTLKAKFIKAVSRDLLSAKRAAGNKDKQRALLLRRKAEIVAGQKPWVDSHVCMLAEYCRTDLPKNYVPQSLHFVVCREQWQHDLWRIVKLTHWSMPPNEYVGRRKQILVFDGDYLLGLVGLASCIWGLTARDKWIGWDVDQKRKRINYLVDAYVLGAIPPYNGQYRGSKLLAYLTASDEMREIWRSEYGFSPAAVVTTTLFGHSAVLNRLKHDDVKLWHNLGYTRGLGTMHFSLETVKTAKELLARADITVPDRLNSGPNWKLRLMRTAIEAVGLRAEDYLTHGYKRGVYVMEYAENAKEFLVGQSGRLKLNHYKADDLLESWQKHSYHSSQAI
jgi:hypothetical protein